MLTLPVPPDTLTDAEQQFALWLAAHPRQTRAAQCAAYARFAGTPIDPVGLKALRTRREFFQFYKDARQTAAAQVARAQALALEMYPAGMRAHARALARADAAGDYKAVPALTENIWKRILPVHDERAAPATVTINLTTERLAALAAPVIDVEVEELPPPADVGPEPT